MLYISKHLANIHKFNTLFFFQKRKIFPFPTFFSPRLRALCANALPSFFRPPRALVFCRKTAVFFRSADEFSFSEKKIRTPPKSAANSFLLQKNQPYSRNDLCPDLRYLRQRRGVTYDAISCRFCDSICCLFLQREPPLRQKKRLFLPRNRLRVPLDNMTRCFLNRFTSGPNGFFSPIFR